jgi:hypothetical protein
MMIQLKLYSSSYFMSNENESMRNSEVEKQVFHSPMTAHHCACDSVGGSEFRYEEVTYAASKRPSTVSLSISKLFLSLN